MYDWMLLGVVSGYAIVIVNSTEVLCEYILSIYIGVFFMHVIFPVASDNDESFTWKTDVSMDSDNNWYSKEILTGTHF